MKDKTLHALAPTINTEWRDDFVVELRLQGASGTAIADALVEVETHCVESNQEALDAFGPAKEYAQALDMPNESTWTPAQLIRTWGGICLFVGGYNLIIWGGVAAFQGQRAELSAGTLISGGVGFALMVLLFIFGDSFLRLLLERTVWGAVIFVLAIAVTVVSGLPFREILLGSVDARVPLILGGTLLAAWVVFSMVLKRTGKSLDDPLIAPTSSTTPQH